MLYQLAFRIIFRHFDPEWIHHFVALGLRGANRLGITRIGAIHADQVTPVRALGIEFEGAFGLAAGFDKNAKLIRALGDLGFSHVEIGTVTAVAQPGNAKPRLFRLIDDRALINRMGFNNDGALRVAQRLGRLRAKYGENLPVIGVNIGKSKITEPAKAAEDYRYSAKLLAPFADYLAVNVSSPNTPGLRDLQSVEALRPILTAVLEESLGLPVVVKIAPDLADADILAVAELACELELAGIIATNTTIGRSGLKANSKRIDEIGAGGLSGAPLAQRSLEVLRLLAPYRAKGLDLISVGGIETAEQAKERLNNGASLVQGYTGFIYEGPFWARAINRNI